LFGIHEYETNKATIDKRILTTGIIETKIANCMGILPLGQCSLKILLACLRIKKLRTERRSKIGKIISWVPLVSFRSLQSNEEEC